MVQNLVHYKAQLPHSGGDSIQLVLSEPLWSCVEQGTFGKEKQQTEWQWGWTAFYMLLFYFISMQNSRIELYLLYSGGTNHT